MAILTATAEGSAGLRRRTRSARWFALALALFFQASAHAADVKEYRVKAAFLYNFTQFVDWPAAAFPDEQAPLIIGILGENPFGVSLEEAVRGERVNNRPLVVAYYQRFEEIGSCHILYIGRNATSRFEQAQTTLQGRSILTVGETETFVRRGGMISFATENKKIRLKINLGVARAAHLSISSQLLRSAEVVDSRK